jgi:hypothetical protein
MLYKGGAQAGQAGKEFAKYLTPNLSTAFRSLGQVINTFNLMFSSASRTWSNMCLRGMPWKSAHPYR